MIEFTVFEEPRGKGRPRFQRNGHTYTDNKTREFEELVKEAFIASGCKPIPESVPINMQIRAGFKVPKSDSKRTRESKLSGEIRPTKKPDCDNIIKIVADALNKVAYYDDSQIVSVSCTKHYSKTGYIEITIKDVTP